MGRKGQVARTLSCSGPLSSSGDQAIWLSEELSQEVNTATVFQGGSNTVEASQTSGILRTGLVPDLEGALKSDWETEAVT